MASQISYCGNARGSLLLQVVPCSLKGLWISAAPERGNSANGDSEFFKKKGKEVAINVSGA